MVQNDRKRYFFCRLIQLIIIFDIVLFFACSCEDSDNIEIQDNDYASEWINRVKIPSSSISIFDGEEIAFSIMPCDQKTKYIDRLKDVQYAELSKNEYLILTGKNLEKNHSLIIRAVYTQAGGNFEVVKNDKNEYYVHHMVMGSRIWEYNKAILIIEVDQLPGEIFNGYTVVK